MTKLFLFRGKSTRQAKASATAPAMHATALVRAFVETGDERCPLAGIWSRLPACDRPTDEPHLTQPAMGTLLPWRAFHCALIVLPYNLV